MSIGEYRVGVSFNPGGNKDVARLKELAAAFIDECQRQSLEPFTVEDGLDHEQMLEEKLYLYKRAMREAESAAMWAVKAATKSAHS